MSTPAMFTDLTPELQEYHDFAMLLAKQAGKMIQESYTTRTAEFSLTVDTKANISDLVTAVDKAVEDLTIKAISARFPSHMFIGEETTAAGGHVELTDALTWVVDPVDGTMNFVHGFPFTCYSLALLKDKQPLLGVVNCPAQRECFIAIRGHGSFVNSTRMPVFPRTPLIRLDQSLVVTEFGAQRELFASKMGSIAKVVQSSRGVRSLGSAALNLCYVAKGCLDLYFEAGLHIWDMAAAVLVLQESGGMVCGYQGEALDLCLRKVVAARAVTAGNEEQRLAVVKSLMALLDGIEVGRD